MKLKAKHSFYQIIFYKTCIFFVVYNKRTPNPSHAPPHTKTVNANNAKSKTTARKMDKKEHVYVFNLAQTLNF